MGLKKVKISSVKRAQHLKSKKNFSQKQPKKSETKSLQQQKGGNKQGVQKNIFSKKSKKKENHPKQLGKKRHIENFDDDHDGDEILENIIDSIDPDDLELLELSKNRSKKRKRDETCDQNIDEGDELEKEHAKKIIKDEQDNKRIINLLPIKTKDGKIITRTTKIDFKQKINQLNEGSSKINNEVDDDEIAGEEFEDSDDDIVRDEDDTNKYENSEKVVSTTDLLILRQQEIDKQKYRIGIICSGILEKPEDKMKNFSALFDLIEEVNENGSANLLSIRKIAMMSIAEVFKDILPEYRVGQVDTKFQIVRKSTLERVTYENALLQQFKKYLQKMEKITGFVTKKGGKRTPENIKLAEIAVKCLCDILLSHPYFNYVQNIGQLLVYMLNCHYIKIRENVSECFRNLFSQDKKLDMSLYIIRRINHLIKTKANNVHTEMITCFMGLKLKNINLDAEKENELKQKKLESHRQRVLNLSKKERKRRKKLIEVNKELEETKAEENKQTKQYKLTEITKMVFTIYFRVLKNDPNSKLLSACLEGLAEYAHVINLDFFSDLIEILNKLLQSNELDYRQQLHCIQTIFSILSGHGEALTIDPIRFYGHLYKILLIVHAGKNHDDFLIIIKTLNDVLIKRRKSITKQRLLAFIKRLLTISLYLIHNGTLASLGIVKTVMQFTNSLDVILDTDSSFGAGIYNPELEDPEYCNAQCTALYELSNLLRYYHPTVQKFAKHILSGVPASGEGSLPPEIGKLTPEELFTQFDSSQMAFNPSIPPPKSYTPKLLHRKKHIFTDPKLKKYCLIKINQQSFPADNDNEILDFYEKCK